MIDESENENDSIKVLADEAGIPYLVVAAGQVEQLRVLLGGAGLKYVVNEKVPGVDGVIVQFDRKDSLEEIQRVLDGIN